MRRPLTSPVSPDVRKPAISAESTLRRRLAKFMALSFQDRILFFKLWILLFCVALLLRVLDFQRTRRLLDRLSPSGTRQAKATEEGMAYALDLGRLTKIAGRYVPANGTCLRQSLLVWWLLRRRGLPADLRIGVSKGEVFAAHAWVELDGLPVNDEADVGERLTPLMRLDP